MDTSIYKTESLTDWKLWFRNELLKYQRWIVYLLIAIIVNFGVMLYIAIGKKNVIGWSLVIPLIFLIVNEIAYIIRKKDVEDLLSASIDLTETKTLTVTSIKGKEINKDYCYNYMKACGEKIKIGHKYKITYLKKTMGKYIIDWIDLDEDALKPKDDLDELKKIAQEKENIENIEKSEVDNESKVRLVMDKKESLSDNTDGKIDLDEELAKRGLDIEEIKRELYDRQKEMDTNIRIDIDKIINKGGQKVDN